MIHPIIYPIALALLAAIAKIGRDPYIFSAVHIRDSRPILHLAPLFRLIAP